MSEEINYKKEFVIAFIGASAGAILTILIGGWNNLNEAKFRLLLDEVKDHTLDINKESLVESTKARKEYELVLNDMRRSYEKFSTYEEAADNLVKSYQEKSGIEPNELAEIVTPSVKQEVSKSINSILFVSKTSNCTWHPIKTHGTFICPDGKISKGMCLTK